MPVLVREFKNSDDEMKKIVLKVVKQCVGNEGLTVSYIKAEMLPEFFGNYWIRKNALDRKNQRQLVETTVAVAGKIGGADVTKRIIEYLKDDNEKFRNVVLETLEKVFFLYGVADVNSRME